MGRPGQGEGKKEAGRDPIGDPGLVTEDSDSMMG